MKRRDRELSAAQSGYSFAGALRDVVVAEIFGKPTEQIVAFLVPFLVFFRREKRSDDEIAGKPHDVERLVGEAEFLALQLGRLKIVAGGKQLATRGSGAGETFFDDILP